MIWRIALHEEGDADGGDREGDNDGEDLHGVLLLVGAAASIVGSGRVAQPRAVARAASVPEPCETDPTRR